MRVPFPWLLRHLETTLSPGDIADRLTMLGLEAGDILDRREELAPFTLARVLGVRPHPAADRLHLCQIETGAGERQIVCGAPNVRAGMMAVFAPPGCRIPATGATLKAGVIRGEFSGGMLVSAHELGLPGGHDSIIELPPDAGEPGAAFAPLCTAGEPVIVISVTPDRGDCLGIRGIARDLAAAGAGRLRPYETGTITGCFDSPMVPVIAPGAESLCTRLVGRVFRGVRNGTAPAWMRELLAAAGLRPVSALVDVTSWLTLDLGRPAHVFDLDRLSGPLAVRTARRGETLHTLDDRVLDMRGGECVIADDSGIQALAGVIGGRASGVGPETRSVFLEIAVFDPDAVSASGRTHNVLSEARFRFERGVDPAFADTGETIAAALIHSLCGGEASHPVVAGQPPPPARTTRFHPGAVARLGGISPAPARQAEILSALGFAIAGTDGEDWQVTIPSWRPDVALTVDLVGEILRIEGYDSVPGTPLPPGHAPFFRPALSPRQARERLVRRVLAGRGLNEAICYTFIPEPLATLFSIGAPLLLDNPLASDQAALRPSPLPSLVAAVMRAMARGYRDNALFEAGPAFSARAPQDQRLVAAVLRSGLAVPRNPHQPARPVDCHDARADAIALLSALGAPAGSLRTGRQTPPWYHPGRSGSLFRDPGTILALFGELSPALLERIGATGPMAACEIFPDALPLPEESSRRRRKAFAASGFPASERDFAFLVDSSVEAETLVRVVRSADRRLVRDVTVFDVYAGKGVPEGSKSIAVAVRLESGDHTLTEAEISDVSERITAAVLQSLGGRLRSGP